MPRQYIDLTGKRFGKLIVTGFSHSAKGNRYWSCQCDCGKTTTVHTNSLAKPNSTGTKSCGCLRAEASAKAIRSNVVDLVGVRFGRLIVLNLCEEKTGKYRYWTCRCVCGEIRHLQTSSLTSGSTTSCGCYHKEVVNRPLTHGQSCTSEYKTWGKMLSRCYNENDKSFEDYGGRGITVCDRWHLADNFLADMGRKPSKDHSIERIDNNGNYEPGNCKWATKTEQANNRRSSKLLTHNGETRTVAQWARITGIHPTRIFARITNLGWSVHDALTKKPRELKKRIPPPEELR